MPTCPICFEEVTAPLEGATCAHTNYHRACLERWHGVNASCPECRAPAHPPSALVLSELPTAWGTIIGDSVFYKYDTFLRSRSIVTREERLTGVFAEPTEWLASVDGSFVMLGQTKIVAKPAGGALISGRIGANCRIYPGAKHLFVLKLQSGKVFRYDAGFKYCRLIGVAPGARFISSAHRYRAVLIMNDGTRRFLERGHGPQPERTDVVYIFPTGETVYADGRVVDRNARELVMPPAMVAALPERFGGRVLYKHAGGRARFVERKNGDAALGAYVAQVQSVGLVFARA